MTVDALVIYTPYVELAAQTVLLLTALIGFLLAFRKLRRLGEGQQTLHVMLNGRLGQLLEVRQKAIDKAVGDAVELNLKRATLGGKPSDRNP